MAKHNFIKRKIITLTSLSNAFETAIGLDF